jgi:hypothetical protein
LEPGDIPLGPGVAAKHVAESEQASGGLTHGLCSHFGIGVGTVATGKKALLAEPALPAANGKGNDDAIADLEIFDFGAQFNNLAHVLVAENVTPLHRWLVTVDEVKVRPTDGAGADLDDRIAGMLYLGIRNGIYSDVAFSVPA